MLIRTDNPLGFELEFSLRSTCFFLRVPRVCEVLNSPGDFGWVYSPWSEVVGATSRKSRQTTV